MKQILQYLLILTGLSSSLFAQDAINSFSFTYFVSGIPISNTVATTNGFIQFPDTTLGKTSAVTFVVLSNSKVSYSLTNAVVNLVGPPSAYAPFTLSSTSAIIPPGGTGQVVLSFTPTAATPLLSVASFSFELKGETGLTFPVTVNLFANTLKPQLVTSYIQPDTGNATPLQSGFTIQFPRTAVNQTKTAQLVVTNLGNGAGTLDSLSITGSGFTFTNLPLTPATVAAGGTFTAGITFTPLAAQIYTGMVTARVGGVTSTYNLSGQGTSSAFTYDTLTSAGSTPLQPNGTITLPDTSADGFSKNSTTVRVINSGNQDGVISTILASGADFQIANAPVLPVTLKPGDIAVFNVVFFPTKAGVSTGRLQIGNDLFNLTGNALGSALSLAVDLGPGPVAVANKAVVSLPNTVVGEKRIASINVTNTGNLPVVISGIGVAGTGFTVVGLPSIPATLTPSQTIQFQVQFAPTTVGVITGTVTINDQTLTLLGVGSAPPALPQVNFTNLPAVVASLQQHSVGVQLAIAYPYDLKGTLTLAFLPDSFLDDPSIQFAIGGRTINFKIPANTTQAVFLQASGAVFGALAPFQTGTVSGTISFSAAGFTVGQVDITPGTIPVKSLTIPAGPPQLTSVRVDSTTSNQVVLLISGYSTTRSVSQLAFQFTGVAGSNVATTSSNVDVSSAFTNWYSNIASAVFGSQFTASVTISISGDPTALKTITVTASNSKGTSATQTVALR